MTNDLIVALTFFAALSSALTAGVFFAFSTFVMRGLAALPPAQGLAAMQSINVKAITPLFMAALFLPALASIGLAIAALADWAAPGSPYLLAGGVLYVAGTIVVTIAANVPRNNALAAARPGTAEGHELWARYVTTWTAWNHVRTVAPLAAAAAFVAALIAG